MRVHIRNFYSGHSLMAVLITLLFIPVTAFGVSDSTADLVPVDKVQWGLLNPLRGSKSPGAADLWGDRTASGATGMLVRFGEGFASPPHIHNISYRGIVIEGAMHNDDPGAARMWLPTGSFWTQPAGENHITAARDDRNLIYLEIDNGPYLVQPAEQQFDNGEHPIAVHTDNLVWLGREAGTASLASVHLWGSTRPGAMRGQLVQVPKGIAVRMKTTASEVKLVVIKGRIGASLQGRSVDLLPGSYIGAGVATGHSLVAVDPSWLYVRSDDAVIFSDENELQAVKP